jgi:hypothetical protein
MMSFIACTYTALEKYYYNNQVKEDGMGGACGTHGREENFIKIFCNKPLKRPLSRPRYRWQNNIKTGVKN